MRTRIRVLTHTNSSRTITTLLLRTATFNLNIKLYSVLHGAPDINMRLINTKLKIKANNLFVVDKYYRLKLLITILFTRINLRLVHDFSDKYILLSKEFIPIFKKLSFLHSENKILAISNPITIHVDVNTHIDPKSKLKQILYVGRMDLLNKNVDRVLYLWANLFQSYTDWKLVLVGDGPDRIHLEQLAATLNLERITFVGFQKEEPIEFYRDSSILLLTSDLEGFGLVVVEAMRLGVVPIVYGSYKAIYDILDDGVNGFITPYKYNKEYTLSKLKTLLDNERLLIQMSDNACEKSFKFTIEHIASIWNDLF